MARARMIANAICADKKINELSDDTSRLAFTWLVTFADAEGRTYGDPSVLRSMLFPRREDVTIAQIEGYIREWAAVGLVTWYESENDWWISFPAFAKNQPGLRADREAPSRVPAPPDSAEQVRTNAGVSPDQLPVKLREGKLKEEKGRATPDQLPPTPAETTKADPAFAALWKLLTNEHIVTNMGDVLRDDVSEMFGLCTDGRIWREAVKRAKSRDPSGANWAFVKRIMNDYLKAGTFDKPGGNGHGPPGKPTRSTLMSDIDHEVLDAIRKTQAVKARDGPASPA